MVYRSETRMSRKFFTVFGRAFNPLTWNEYRATARFSLAESG